MTTLLETTQRLNEATDRLRANQFISEVREKQAQAIDSFTLHLNGVFESLGRHVARIANEVGGLVLEKKRTPTSSEVERIDHIVTAAQLQDWQREMLEAPYERRFGGAYEALTNSLRRHGYAALTRQEIAERCIAEGGRRLGLMDIREQTRKALFEVLEFAQANGLSPQDAAAYIKEFIPAGQFVNAGSGYRAEMIARTEINHAWRYASIESYRSMPGVTHVIMYDGDSDAQCSARNGSIVTIDEAQFEMFVTHPNCVLAFAPASLY